MKTLAVAFVLLLSPLVGRAQVNLEMSTITFSAHESSISKSAEKQLHVIDSMLAAIPSLNITINGYANIDECSKDSIDCIILSLHRATATEEWLIKQGIDPKRLVARGFGSDCPLRNPKTKEDAAANRRVEFLVVEPN